MSGCECNACTKAPESLDRREAFIRRVHNEGVQAGPGYWTAYAQGYLAALCGEKIPDAVARGCHMVDFDFKRGHAKALTGQAA